jgi:hypothetical protein
MEDKVCPFCGEEAPEMSLTYFCGTLENDDQPRTKMCWMGYAHKLKTKVNDLQARVNELEDDLSHTQIKLKFEMERGDAYMEELDTAQDRVKELEGDYRETK